MNDNPRVLCEWQYRPDRHYRLVAWSDWISTGRGKMLETFSRVEYLEEDAMGNGRWVEPLGGGGRAAFVYAYVRMRLDLDGGLEEAKR